MAINFNALAKNKTFFDTPSHRAFSQIFRSDFSIFDGLFTFWFSSNAEQRALANARDFSSVQSFRGKLQTNDRGDQIVATKSLHAATFEASWHRRAWLLQKPPKNFFCKSIDIIRPRSWQLKKAAILVAILRRFDGVLGLRGVANGVAIFGLSWQFFHLVALKQSTKQTKGARFLPREVFSRRIWRIEIPSGLQQAGTQF